MSPASSLLLPPGFPDTDCLSRTGDAEQNPRTAHLRRGLALLLADQRERRRVPQPGLQEGLSISGSLLAQLNFPHSFYGIDRPEPPPQDQRLSIPNYFWNAK